MRIALIGYGKMGKTIHELVEKGGDEVVFTIDKDNYNDIQKINGNTVDVAIEFSNPESAFKNLKYCIENDVPVVSGTTGWLEDYEKIADLCRTENGAFMYASNYSIGVNIFFEMNKFLARKMENYRAYKCKIEEIHHTEKLDAPSGTAITLAEGIIDNNKTLRTWKLDNVEKDSEIPIVSKRIDKIPGTHIINYTSEIDELEIKHKAYSRLGFASGAYEAAKWLAKRKGVYSIQDMLFG